MYRHYQGRQGYQGPVFIYTSTLLFLRGCSDHRIAKKICLGKLLTHSGKFIDYVYHVVGPCTYLPTYQVRIRARDTLNLFLKSQHRLQLASRYSIKIDPAYKHQAIRKWAKRTIVAAGTQLAKLDGIRSQQDPDHLHTPQHLETKAGKRSKKIQRTRMGFAIYYPQ